MRLILLNGIVAQIGQGIKDVFFWILYTILKALCYVVDLCQLLVKKLAGIDTSGMLWGDKVVSGAEDSSTVTGDLVEIIIRSDIVRNLFISLLVLGIILLLIVTFVAIWKSEWDFGKDGNSKTKTINSALKALFNFIAVPVIAFFGIFVGNALLRAIDGATGGSNEKSMTSFVLSSAFSDACRYNYRYEGDNNAWVNANLTVYYEKDSEGNFVLDESGNRKVTGQGILNYFRSSNGDVQVNQILDAFKNDHTISKDKVSSAKYRIYNSDGTEATEYTEALVEGKFTFTFDNGDLVTMFFDNSKINYILIYIVLFFMIKAMLTITFGLVKRLYYVVILFIISPPIVAMAPINDKALGSWRSAFISNLCSAFVTIGIYNIFLSVYPAFEKIKFPGVGSFVNFFVSLLMISVGLMCIDSISGMIAKWFGVGELYSDSTDKGKSIWGGAFSRAGSGFKPLTMGLGAVGKAGQFVTTARYEGLGAAAKNLKTDTTGAIKGAFDKTPISTMYKASGMTEGLKTFKDDSKHKQTLGVKDSMKGLRQANKSAINDFKSLGKDLGVSARKKSVNGILNNQDYQNYVKNEGIVKKYAGQWAKLTSEQRQEKMKAKKYMQGLSKAEIQTRKKQQDFVDTYDTVKKTGGRGLNILPHKFLVQDGKNFNMIRQQQGAKLGKANAEATKDAIAKQTAKNDAEAELVKKEIQNANAKIVEANKAKTKAEAEEILKTTKESVQELKKRISDTKALDKANKKLDQILDNLNRKGKK